jgi:hypothetical protein
LEFTADHFSSLSLSLEGKESGVVFKGMVHIGSMSLHAFLEESTNEDDTTSSRGGELRLRHLSRM